jgi:ABC-type phosphate transport system substrate-binding protein
LFTTAQFTWLVVPAHIPDENKHNALAGFLKWMLGPGQRQSAALGFLALPQDLVTRETAAITRLH